MTTKASLGVVDPAVLDRDNHTGTQPISSVSGLEDELVTLGEAIDALEAPVYGENANGSFLKFPDGTLICWFTSAATITTSSASGGIFTSSGGVMTFPEPFIAIPNVTPTVLTTTGVCWPGLATGLSVTQVNTVLLSAGAGGAGRRGYIAVGRWKA